MKTKLMALMLLAGGSMFAATRFSVGVNLGGYNGYYNQAPVYSAIPPCPGPGYVWANGYWNAPVYNNYRVEQRYDRRDFDRDDYARRDFDRRDFDRGRVQNYNRGFEQNRGFDQNRSFNSHDNGNRYGRR